MIAPGGRQEPGVGTVSSPVSPPQCQGILGEGNVAVFGPLAAVDMDLETWGIDVGHWQGEGLGEPQSQTVDGGKVDLIVQGCGGIEKAPDFFNTEHRWESGFGLGAAEREGLPVTLEDVLEEELDATVADTHGSGGEVIDIVAVQEVGLELGFGEEVRGFVVELSEQADLTDIGFLSTFALAAELESAEHLLTQRGHEISPFLS